MLTILRIYQTLQPRVLDCSLINFDSKVEHCKMLTCHVKNNVWSKGCHKTVTWSFPRILTYLKQSVLQYLSRYQNDNRYNLKSKLLQLQCVKMMLNDEKRKEIICHDTVISSWIFSSLFTILSTNIIILYKVIQPTLGLKYSTND